MCPSQKKTKFTNLRINKEESIHFTTQREFCDRQGDLRGPGIFTIFQTPNGGYAVQDYSSNSAINCFHCTKDGYRWRNCTQYLRIKDRKK